MRYFVTGSTGWIGSAVVSELLAHGHQVLGLTRSDTGADTLAAQGAEPLRGDLNDLDSLRSGAAATDGVVHLAYHHDFAQMPEAARMDRAAMAAMGEVLTGTGKPFVFASGVLGLATGRLGTEADSPDPSVHPRVGNAAAVLALADKGVRVAAARFAPTVHGAGDHGFVSTLVAVARERGVSAYVGDGSNRWPAVHRLDAATLVRLGLENAPGGAVLHAVAEEGVPAREIAEAIGRGLGLPVESVPAGKAAEHFGWIGGFFAADAPVSSEVTRRTYGWEPAHPGLIADLDAGYYFK